MKNYKKLFPDLFHDWDTLDSTKINGRHMKISEDTLQNILAERKVAVLIGKRMR